MKKLILAVFLIGVLACGCIGTQVPVVEVKAKIVLEGDKPVIQQMNVTPTTVNVLNAPKASSMVDFPSVDAVAIVNGRYISYWDAKPYTGEGTYNLLIGFKKGTEPKEGDVVRVVVKVVNEEGESRTTKIKDIIWREL